MAGVRCRIRRRSIARVRNLLRKKNEMPDNHVLTRDRRRRAGRPRAPQIPDPVDAAVGVNIRMCRIRRGLSQKQLGDAVGITFQQVQKYEKGVKRLSASRLYQLAVLLRVQVSDLFAGLETNQSECWNVSHRASVAKMAASREVYHLLQSWAVVPARLRHPLLSSLKSLGRRSSHPKDVD